MGEPLYPSMLACMHQRKVRRRSAGRRTLPPPRLTSSQADPPRGLEGEERDPLSSPAPAPALPPRPSACLVTTIYIEWWGNRPVARPLLWRVAGAGGTGRAPMGGMRRLAVQERASVRALWFVAK